MIIKPVFKTKQGLFFASEEERADMYCVYPNNDHWYVDHWVAAFRDEDQAIAYLEGIKRYE